MCNGIKGTKINRFIPWKPVYPIYLLVLMYGNKTNTPSRTHTHTHPELNQLYYSIKSEAYIVNQGDLIYEKRAKTWGGKNLTSRFKEHVGLGNKSRLWHTKNHHLIKC